MAASHANSPAPAPSGRFAGLGKRLRATASWLLTHPLVAFPLGALLLLAVIGGGYGLTQIFLHRDPTLEEQLTVALEKLDAEDFAEARRLAAEVGTPPERTYEELGGPMFILGVVLMHDADEHLESHRRTLLYRLAARYLEEARDRGFPEGREAEGLRRLATSLVGAGRYAQAVPVLKQVLAEQPENASSYRWLLADACLKMSPPDLAAAERETQAYLQEADLPLPDRQRALLRLAELRLVNGNAADCREQLAALQALTSLKPEALVLEARSHLLEAEAAEDADVKKASLQAALAALKAIDEHEGVDHKTAAKADYLGALCHLRAKETKAAEQQLLRVRQRHFGTDEAFAATLDALELSHGQGRMEETVALVEQLVEEAPPADAYKNDWLPQAQLKQRLTALLVDLIDRDSFADAIRLATLLPPLLPNVEMLPLRARAHVAAAHALRGNAAKEPYLQAGITLAEARDHERLAGADFGQLAELRFVTKHYEEDLWNCGANLLAGQAYDAAVKCFRRMLKQEIRYRRPDVLAGLGESLLALGRPDEAAEVLARCLEQYPKHPATYRARLIAANADGELGRLEEAKRKLNDNLYGFSLTPESSEWRESLFALGRLLIREGMELETKSRLEGVDRLEGQELHAGLAILEEAHDAFAEAAKVLTEAVRRFPQASETVLARYRIAEAHRHAAKWPRKKLLVTNIETTRVQLNRQLQHNLGLALEEYGRLLAQLDQEQTTQQRNPLDLSLVRNCYFERADVLFDLGRFEEALTAYSAATNRYQAEPEALEAYVQIAACYRRLDKPAEARGTLEQARVVLKRIRSDADFTRTTRYNREEWGNLLAWLATL